MFLFILRDCSLNLDNIPSLYLKSIIQYLALGRIFPKERKEERQERRKGSKHDRGGKRQKERGKEERGKT